MKRLALLGLTLAAACGDDGGGAVPVDAAPPPIDAPDVAGRARADRPDDVLGPQVHVFYVLPADGVDRQLDVDGSIARSVAAWNGWLAAQSGGPRLRLDTAGGALDITYARLPTSDAGIAAEGAYVRERVEQELHRAGLLPAGKLAAVYYDGSSTYSCGGGAWPPVLIGKVAAFYLRGQPPGAPACADQRLSPDGVTMGYADFAMLHEIFHTLGAVAECAPNQVLEGHTGDSPTDLMFSGDQPWHPSVLDVHRDDYWDSHLAGCVDVSRSALLDPTPANATLPSGW
ncbi:MAG TPA: hypothetical protein VHE35_14640 [Kofleriaceae bacterium]|nr:hypothetical protein [Kofleriaceae bacterium]